MILAERAAPFLKHWYESYRTFNGSNWNDHSVLLPKFLAQNLTRKLTRERAIDMVYVLSHRALFWPLWNTPGIMRMYAGRDYSLAQPGVYGIHLWESMGHHFTLPAMDAAHLAEHNQAIWCASHWTLQLRGWDHRAEDDAVLQSRAIVPDGCRTPQFDQTTDGTGI